jgi:plasmid stabilization system protein ParE
VDLRRREVIWTDAGQACLHAALAHVAVESPMGAERLLEAILAMADSLEHFAERGRVIPEIGRDDIREVFVFSYRIVYRVTDKDVRIQAVIHGARDLSEWTLPRSG